MNSMTEPKSPENQLEHLIPLFPGPDADTAAPPEDATEKEKEKPKADPIFKGVVIMLGLIAVLLGAYEVYSGLYAQFYAQS
ncbi:hypothetical protein EsH8_XIV_000027 [Colletotrichum jinshuiense]